jgi:hypothetical protein
VITGRPGQHMGVEVGLERRELASPSALVEAAQN